MRLSFIHCRRQISNDSMTLSNWLTHVMWPVTHEKPRNNDRTFCSLVTFSSRPFFIVNIFLCCHRTEQDRGKGRQMLYVFEFPIRVPYFKDYNSTLLVGWQSSIERHAQEVEAFKVSKWMKWADIFESEKKSQLKPKKDLFVINETYNSTNICANLSCIKCKFI